MLLEPQSILEQIFVIGTHPINAEKGTYLPSLVILSYVIATVGAYVSLSLLEELWLASTSRAKTYLHLVSALALGIGIWSMHFIGMLAYDMEMVHRYDISMTLLSMLIAASVAYGFIYIVRKNKQHFATYLLASILLGCAICGMHYTGMAAMIMDADLRYKPAEFILSVMIAIGASAAAIGIIFYLKDYQGSKKWLWQLMASLIIGAAICGMHYTGMAATVFFPYADCRFNPDQTYYTLAGAVGLISGSIFIIAIALNIAHKSQREQGRYSLSWNIIPITIAIFGLFISAFSAAALQNYNDLENRQRFNVLIGNAEGKLTKRYELYRQALYGGLGLFEASDFVSREDWGKFVLAQNVDEALPGINGIGFIEYVKEADLSSFLEAAKADDAPDFTNHPQTNFDDKFIIKYIEPVERNKEAVGLDIGFEQNRRTAAEKAIRTGQPSLTEKIELVQDNKKRAGFLFLLPFYGADKQIDTEQRRINAIKGWIYAPFIGEYFLQNLGQDEIAYAVFDGARMNGKSLIYQHPLFDSDVMDSDLAQTTTFEIAGTPWMIAWHATPRFQSTGNEGLPLVDFILGLFITALLCGMTYSLNRRGLIVQKLVDERTAELQEVNAELEEFAYRTSHDLRSPIISSLSLIELAGTMIENDQTDDAKTSLMHVQKSLSRLRDLIDDILQLTVTRNKDEETTEVSIQKVLEEALEKFSNMDDFDRLDIQKDLKFDDVILTKQLRFTLIVENLLSNAIKYQDPDEENPFVKISTYSEGDNFILQVTDNGIGIPANQRTELFKMFKRFHPKVAYGSGLGLYLLKKSVDVLGGDIRYENPGKGTRFKLEINAKQVRK